jgi:hypothetical protein
LLNQQKYPGTIPIPDAVPVSNTVIVASLRVLGLIDEYPFPFSSVFDHFQYLASLGTAGSGWERVGPVFKFYHPEKTMVTIEPMCRTAADPRDGELATDFGLSKRRDILGRYGSQECELLDGRQ